MAALDLFGVGPFGVRPMHDGPPPAPKAEGGKLSAADAAKQVKRDEAEMQNRARWAERRLAQRIDQVIESVKGTPEQADKISKLASAAFQDLRPLHEKEDRRLRRAPGPAHHGAGHAAAPDHTVRPPGG